VVGVTFDPIMSPALFHMLEGAPRPVAPFSHATEVDDWVFVTGQLPIDSAHDEAPLAPDVETQTRRTFDNLLIVLRGLGLGLEHVVVARCFLTHFYEDYERFNEVYASYFPKNRRPARTCIGVTGLARHARVEIDFIAVRR
jgi:reactive intermediate/imine deaminase